MRNDGSEELALAESNVFEIASLRIKLKLAEGQSADAYRQLGESLRLLGKCRNLFEVVMDHPLFDDIDALIKEIDEFYPQAKEK
jgi:hypothetical protein